MTTLINFDRATNWTYAQSLGRAFAGSIIFSLPLLMTMEMWWLGFTLDKMKLLQFILVNFVVLIGLARVSGFERAVNWYDDILDALAAYGIAVFGAAAILWLFGVIQASMSAGEVVGKIAVQSVPASFGAMLATKLLGESADDPEQERARNGYGAQLFLMLAGALFLGFNVAPTEEMMLISYQMNPARSIVLVLASIIFLHSLVYTVGFRGEERFKDDAGFFSIFLRYSMAGYAIAALVSLYVLWTFGRTAGADAAEIASIVAVLGFPAAIGAAIARLVV